MARPITCPNPLRLRFGEFELDEANASLRCKGEPVALPPTPFALLCALARQPGMLLTKDALLDEVWGHQFVSESVLKTAVSDLRMALRDSAREPRFIETVSRRGYRFIGATTDAGTLATAVAVASAVSAQETQAAPFIGRADALRCLQACWDRACVGQRSLVWVTGEPGIGKTTLIEHFAASLGGAASARGQCVEHHGSGEPYLPLLEALAERCRSDPALPELLRRVAPTWLMQMPWLGSADEREALQRELAGVGPDRMLREMGELLDRYTQERPLLLITEDLHWSDRATLQLIDHVARRRGNARLMWLASFRLAEVVALDHPLSRLRHELRLHRLCEEVVLDPFSETEVAAYVSQHSPTLSHDEGFVRGLHERTDGVPLFVSSLVGEVLEGGDHEAAPERLAAVTLPDNLGALIDHYIARLAPELRALLSAAAVCGDGFRLETLARALDLEPEDIALDCERLVRSRLWLAPPRHEDHAAQDPPHAFRHALFRQGLYERTPATTRVQLHRKVGTALEQERAAGVPVAANELAMHFDRGRQPLTALRYYTEAAEAALAHFSPSACLTLTERALTVAKQAPKGAEREAAELALATLQGMSAIHAQGVGEVAVKAFEHAYALLASQPQHPMRNRLLHGWGYACALRGQYVEALVVAERAEALAAVSNDPQLMLVACFLHGEVHHLQGRTQVAREWMERGIAISRSLCAGADEIFAADPQVTLLGMLAIDLVRCGFLQQGRALIQQARARAADLRQPMTRLTAVWHDALLEVRLGGTQRLATLAQEMQALVDEFSLAHGRSASQWFIGRAEAHSGHPVEGHRRIRQACEHNMALGMRLGSSEVQGYAAEALLLAGDLEGAQADLDQALRIADELGEGVYLPQLLMLQATIHRLRGDLASSASVARRAVEEARVQQAPWLQLLALTEVCEHHDASIEEREALAKLTREMPEADDAEPMARARLASTVLSRD